MEHVGPGVRPDPPDRVLQLFSQPLVRVGRSRRTQSPSDVKYRSSDGWLVSRDRDDQEVSPQEEGI